MEDKLKEVIARLKQKEEVGGEEEKKQIGRPKKIEPLTQEQQDTREDLHKQTTVEAKEEPKVEEQREVVEDKEQIEKPVEEQVEKPVEKEEKKNDSELQTAIGQRVYQLQNTGLFRLELLGTLRELNENVTTLNAVIMKIGGLEKEKEEKNSKE